MNFSSLTNFIYAVYFRTIDGGVCRPEHTIAVLTRAHPVPDEWKEEAVRFYCRQEGIEAPEPKPKPEPELPAMERLEVNGIPVVLFNVRLWVASVMAKWRATVKKVREYGARRFRRGIISLWDHRRNRLKKGKRGFIADDISDFASTLTARLPE